jgi:quercetin dioxygenase-like cupin family protein
VAAPGDTLEEPVSGLRIVFRKTARDTAGELLQLDIFFRPGGFVAGEHVHPRQEERFEVVAGAPWFRIAGRRDRLGPGEAITAAPGVRHTWGNDGDDELHAVVEFRPALDTEGFFEDLCALSGDGELDRKGRPRPLQLAAMLHEYREEIALPWVPLPVQRALVGAVARLARRRGYRGRYAVRSGDVSAAGDRGSTEA